MTDRPILFSGPMVRALVDGRKAQTRRVIKARSPYSLFDGGWADEYVLDPGNAEWRERDVKFRIGDRLYVREAWRTGAAFDRVAPRDLPQAVHVAYEADDDRARLTGRLRRGMHMPRWASRLTLVVTDVRVQRLQEISEADAETEGLERAPGGRWSGAEGQAGMCPRSAYALLWNSLNAKRGFGWDANPWVVAYTFQTHRCNIDQMEPGHE